MYCSKCATPLTRDDVYCPKCAKPIASFAFDADVAQVEPLEEATVVHSRTGGKEESPFLKTLAAAFLIFIITGAILFVAMGTVSYLRGR
jgi:hypothetical protein